MQNGVKGQPQKSINTIGLLIIIISGIMIFSNGIGTIAWFIVGKEDETINTGGQTLPADFHFSNLMEISLLMLLLIEIIYLIGGIFIVKKRLWANRMVSVLSILFILIIWGILIAISIAISQIEGMKFFSIVAIMNALLFSTPFILLIKFLNQKKIKQHFA